MTKHRSPDERHAQILMAARQCFLKEGYFATKIDDIARESGLSKGGIYFHFSSKREIFRSLVQHEFDEAMAYIEGVIESSDDLLERLTELSEHFLAQFTSHPDQPRFALITAQMALHDEPTRILLMELQEHYVQLLATLLDEAVAAGAIRPIDTRATAFLLKSLLDGVQASTAVGYTPDLATLLPTTMDLLARLFED